MSDHIFHHVLRLAEAHKLQVQMHTGLQAGNGNTLENSRPVLLNNLFGLYPKVAFDLFHLGWPWMDEVAALAKMYANVTADMCWVHIITPTGARRALHELIETVPLNKILGFGGDYRYVGTQLCTCGDGQAQYRAGAGRAGPTANDDRKRRPGGGSAAASRQRGPSLPRRAAKQA
ncbi:MAG: amidohydrolase family protein [Paludibaculum sp.]